VRRRGCRKGGNENSAASDLPVGLAHKRYPDRLLRQPDQRAISDRALARIASGVL
jgi:hypothetical protein